MLVTDVLLFEFKQEPYKGVMLQEIVKQSLLSQAPSILRIELPLMHLFHLLFLKWSIVQAEFQESTMEMQYH